MSFRFSQPVNRRHRFSTDGALLFGVRVIVRMVVVAAVLFFCGTARSLEQPTVAPLIGTSYANDADGEGVERIFVIVHGVLRGMQFHCGHFTASLRAG